MTLTRNKQKQGKVTTTSGVPRAVGLCAPDPNPSQLYGRIRVGAHTALWYATCRSYLVLLFPFFLASVILVIRSEGREEGDPRPGTKANVVKERKKERKVKC